MWDMLESCFIWNYVLSNHLITPIHHAHCLSLRVCIGGSLREFEFLLCLRVWRQLTSLDCVLYYEI